jgi:hypothetical protein
MLAGSLRGGLAAVPPFYPASAMEGVVTDYLTPMDQLLQIIEFD